MTTRILGSLAPLFRYPDAGYRRTYDKARSQSVQYRGFY